MLQDAIAIYAEGMEAAPSQSGGPALALQMGFVSQAHNTLILAAMALERGFYHQSMGLMRFVSEAWLTYWYLEKFPAEADRWSEHEKSRRPPKAETMLKRIDHPDPSTESHVRMHKAALSRFVHSDSYAVNCLFANEPSVLAVCCGLKFDQGLFDAASMELTLWLGNMLHVVAQHVPLGTEWRSRAAQSLTELLEYLAVVGKEPGASP